MSKLVILVDNSNSIQEKETHISYCEVSSLTNSAARGVHTKIIINLKNNVLS